jgi:thiol:disulfide interchange protein DsbA
MAKKKQKLPEKKSGLKTIHIILALIIISGLAIYLLNSGEKSSEKVPDGNYTKLNKPSTYESGKVKIMEFMKFDCLHCYDLHNNMPKLLEKYPGKLEITYIPIIFPTQSTKSIEAYIIAEQMEKGEEMRDALFKAKFEQGMDVMESTIALENIAAKIGLGSDFNQKFESGTLKNASSENLKLMRDYNVDGTPTVVINGNLMVVPTITNLDTVIGSILEQGS